MNQLGDWVRQRRTQLELTQEEVAALGPLSEKTVRNIESGRTTRLASRTRSALEQALNWPPGSVLDAIKDGRKPAPTAAAEPPLAAPVGPAEEAAIPLISPTPAGSEPAAAPRSPAEAGDTAEGNPAGPSLAVARAVLNMRRNVPLLRETLGPSELETALENLVAMQREAEIALSQSMQWIVNDDTKRREAGQLLYELQQPL